MSGRSHTRTRRRERQRQEARRLAALRRAVRAGRITAADYARITERRQA